MSNIDIDNKWLKRFAREREARKEAEKLLEEKSYELYIQNERLKNLSENLEKLVSKRTLELEEALNNANEANIAKRDFFATVSHELRTPLNGIIGMTHLLKDTDLNNLQKDYVQTVLVSGEILLSLINDILDFSKIEAGKLELEQIDFDLNETLVELIDIVGAKANEKLLDFLIPVAKNVPSQLIGDPNKLKQILINLSSNAIKFTEKGQVKIKVNLVNDLIDSCTLKFEVIDSGIGIPEEKLIKLFSPFTQADASTSRKFGGTGLGLSISKKLVEMMQGVVGVSSKPGQGSNFYFNATFLKQKEQFSAVWESCNLLSKFEAVIWEENEKLAEHLKEILGDWGMKSIRVQSEDDINKLAFHNNRVLFVGKRNELNQSIGLERLGPQFAYRIFLGKEKNSSFRQEIKKAGFDLLLAKPIRKPDLFRELCSLLNIEVISEQQDMIPNQESIQHESHQLKILLVEDNLINQKVAGAMLKNLGYQSKAAGNGVVALQMMMEEKFDLIFMDYQMPEMDGIEATQRIRNGQFGICNPQIPIIAMTANAMKGDQDKCKEAGMDDFLSKPLVPINLKQMLEKWQAIVTK
jgi:two-component system sensor histidine kinase/response regulator